jgi:O-antigen ligase
MLAVLALTAALAAVVAGRLGAGGPRPVLRPLAIAAALASVVAVFAAASVERSPAPEGATAGRFTSAQSNRYAYWEVAVGAFGRHPVLGTGSGGFAVAWLRERTIDESVRDVHSLYLETATELGLAGLALLAVFLAGAGGVAARGRTEAGAVAALVAYALHTGLDWDWEMPAVTLLAVVLLASLAVSGRSGSAAAAPRP